jgi:hypothetical protein
LLRQAGFPVELVFGLGAGAARTSEVDAAEDRLRAASVAVLAALRAVPEPAARALAAEVGQLRPPRPRLSRRFGDLPELAEYRSALAARDAAVAEFDAEHGRLQDSARAAVFRAFRDDPRLRGVLLLSNDDQYDVLARALNRNDRPQWTRKERRRADLFTLYLQRVTTKNETNAHFGPISVGSFADSGGLSWTDGGPEHPTAYFSHWAAEELGRVLAERPGLWPHVRPRRAPLALLTDDGAVVLHESTTDTGLTADWTFTRRPPRSLTGPERWLLDHADGATPVSELAKLWSGDAAELDAAARTLRADRLLIAHFEVPVGEPDPLAALVAVLPPEHPDTAEVVVRLTALRGLVDAFAAGSHDERVRRLAELKERFTELSGSPATRFAGRHYADRGVLHEETLSTVDDVVAGPWLREFVTGELSLVYDVLLTGPRHRITRERRILADWFAGRFGSGAEVSLERFYAGYFADRAELCRQAAEVDAEVDALDADLVGLLTDGARPGDREVVVDRDRVERFLAGLPTGPGAVCNPDLMLAADSRADLVAGRFLAVVGDCHAMRELLTHTSVAPLLAARHPRLAEEITELYRGLVEPDEVLCDVMRTHLDKTDAQLTLPVPDIEFLGRSPKDRRDVLPAHRLRLRHNGSDLHLGSDDRPGRLRLLAPPATGPSIARDPLAAFSFPRHFGGLALRGGDAAHLPRFRCGRVVLQRELWRVDCAELLADDAAAGFRAVTRLRQRLGLPRYVFAKHPGEPKPVFVDLESPLLVAQLGRLARSRTGSVLITEMLPGPGQLWLTRGGRAHTSEVRFAVFG